MGLLSSPKAFPRMKSFSSSTCSSLVFKTFIRAGTFTKASSSSLKMYLGWRWKQFRN
jgi:hypothetical protein